MRSSHEDKELMVVEEKNRIMLYTTDNGKVQVSLMSRDEGDRPRTGCERNSIICA